MIITRALIALSIFTFAPSALAKKPHLEASTDVPCVILEKFKGELEILNADRNQMIPAKLKSGIPCGSWITIKNGWASLRHRQGFNVRMGSDTFVQIFDNEGDRKVTGSDHLVLYKGDAFVSSTLGHGEVRVITANARARLQGGVMIVNYDPSVEQSQTICLENEVKMENRHEPSKYIKISQGEASDLSFKLLRVVPSTPRVVKMAPLKAKLAQFPMENAEIKALLRNVQRRKGRAFAYQARMRGGVRGPAAENDKKRKKYTYERSPKMPADEKANKAWMDHLVGGSKDGHKILYPKRKGKTTGSAGVTINRVPSARHSGDDAEKSRLIEELREIRLE